MATPFNRTFVSEKAVKNKYDRIKNDCNLWKTLKIGETGLGWDASARKLDCSYEWWKRKNACDHIYENVASGEDCVSPSMDPETVNEVHNENVEVEDVERDDGLDGNQDGTQVHNSEMEEL
ncbi:Myb/SANT-like domain-containing protein [Tanacetum coccineum]|uniref:Myb/SANT-like domain-containing protein n=1 Tax=Tanacetum coccineum TaxID=301880 RepID=A0ABQ5I694_9ASTR